MAINSNQDCKSLQPCFLSSIDSVRPGVPHGVPPLPVPLPLPRPEVDQRGPGHSTIVKWSGKSLLDHPGTLKATLPLPVSLQSNVLGGPPHEEHTAPCKPPSPRAASWTLPLKPQALFVCPALIHHLHRYLCGHILTYTPCR